jgi:hypothetical protein
MSDDKKSWSYTERDGNKTTTFAVREISNGYIVRKSVYGKKNDDEMYSEEEETYYKENPFKDKKADEEEKKNETLESVSNLMSSIGGMQV